MSTQSQNIYSERIKAGNLIVTNFTASYISGTFTGKFDVNLPSNSGLKLSEGGFAIGADTSGLSVVGSTLSLNTTITGNRTFVNNVTIQGILSVTGTQSISNVSDLSVSDSKITLLDGTSGSPTLNASIVVDRGTSQFAKILWDENADSWKAGLSGSETNIILNAGYGLTKSGDTLSLDVFNQGPTGSQGSTGPQGNSGPQGDMGFNGEPGPQGHTGLQGYTGPQGLQGETGPQGFQGTQGIMGNTGSQGDTGPQGYIGPQGLIGMTGTVGSTGPQGFQGVTGPQGSGGGSTGSQGSTGQQGSTGPQGFQGVTGPQGSGGGSTGSQGSTGPQGTTGNQGVTGPQGRTGPQGFTGAQGTTGNQGVTGPQGRTGPQGFTGLQGNTGPQGDSANPIINITFSSATSITITHSSSKYPLVQVIDSDGSLLIPQSVTHSSTSEFKVTFATASSGTIIYGGGAGPQGFTGVQGLQGFTGPQGFQGVTGPQGFQGVTGPTGVLRNDVFTSQVVTITHSFGYYPIVQAFDTSGSKILDSDFSLTHSSINSYIISFSNFGIGFTAGTIISGGAGFAFHVDNAVDNRILTSNGTFTGSNAEANLTFDGSTLTVNATASFTGHTIFQQTSEVINTSPGATATSVVYDFTLGSIWYHSTASTNYSANFINLPTTNNRAVTATIVISQGATGYSPTTLRIDGTTQSIKWAGNTYSVSSNKIDIIGFTFLRSGNSWVQILGQISSFG